MTIDEKIDTLNIKIDLVVAMLSAVPVFVIAPHQKHANEKWGKAIKEYQRSFKNYEKEIENRFGKNENNNNTTSFEDTVS